MRLGVSVTPRPLFTPGKDPVPIVQEAGWAPGPVWTKIKIYRTIILPVVLYGCETPSFTLREERRQRVFEIGC